MWMLLKKKGKGKRDICMCWISWRINNHLPCRTAKAELSDAFRIFLSTWTHLLPEDCCIMFLLQLWDLFWKKKMYCMFWGWKWTQTLFVSGSFHFAYNMLTSSVLKHLLSLQNDKGLLIFLDFSCTFLCSIFTSEPSAEDRTEWPVVWEYTISYKYQLSHQKDCLWV